MSTATPLVWVPGPGEGLLDDLREVLEASINSDKRNSDPTLRSAVYHQGSTKATVSCRPVMTETPSQRTPQQVVVAQDFGEDEGELISNFTFR